MNRFKDFKDDKIIRRLLFAALLPFGVCAMAYYIHFNFYLGYPMSTDQADWGTFGDFIGGVLNCHRRPESVFSSAFLKCIFLSS